MPLDGCILPSATVQLSEDRDDIVRFGPFEIEVHARVIRKHGVRVRLQSQPFEVLTVLLESAGTVISREQFRRRIWPEDTFVDFEHGLNAAVTRLRHALGDSAANPRYIETVPRSGYRFIAELQRLATPQTLELPETSEAPATRLRDRRNRIVRNAILVGAAVSLCIFGAVVLPWHSEQIRTAYQPVSLTSFRGLESRRIV
jgi:DNA-binding winged helix-turn-helix (wHTH) protein